jgi:hypothetical protein
MSRLLSLPPQQRREKLHLPGEGHTASAVSCSATTPATPAEATGGFDDASLSAFARHATFNTVMGDVKFGTNGEWTHPRTL